MPRTYKVQVAVEAEVTVPGSGAAANERAAEVGGDVKGDVLAVLARLGLDAEAVDVHVQSGHRGEIVYQDGFGPGTWLAR